MNYLAYLLLALLLTCSVGPSGTEPVSERVQKLFNTMKSHMATCPKEGSRFSFYNCPSHLWPDIMQNFIPVVSSLQTWIRQRIGAGAAIWYYLAKHLGDQIVKYDPQDLVKSEMKPLLGLCSIVISNLKGGITSTYLNV